VIECAGSKLKEELVTKIKCKFHTFLILCCLAQCTQSYSQLSNVGILFFLKIAGQVKQKLLRDLIYLHAILFTQLVPSIMLGTKLLQKLLSIFVTGKS
jgi:hypothetical protein